MVERAIQAWDTGKPAEAAELLSTAVHAAGDLGYL
jgi:hypothetical protein